MRYAQACCLAVLAACGGGSTEPTSEPLKGTAYFTIDRPTCAYTGTRVVTFFIAGDSVGAELLASGATSRGYLTKATSEYETGNNPAVQARFGIPGSALWTYNSIINVPVNGSVTHVFTC
jgi:hypothetical protein